MNETIISIFKIEGNWIANLDLGDGEADIFIASGIDLDTVVAEAKSVAREELGRDADIVTIDQ